MVDKKFTKVKNINMSDLIIKLSQLVDCQLNYFQKNEMLSIISMIKVRHL